MLHNAARSASRVSGTTVKATAFRPWNKGQTKKGFSPGHCESARTTTTRVKKENVIQSEASESLRRFGAKQLKPESKDLRLGRTYKFGSGMRISSRVSGTTVEATAFRPWEKAR